ncbi:pyruvate kinase [Planktomarina temperata]|jgi:pyruvate kinase|nr:pyruvate kinase [Planktomarina temperata]
MIKTLVTIGPTSLNDLDIQYFAERTNLFRLNGSHSDLEWHRKAVSKIREFSPTAFILMDIPGIKPRTDNSKIIKIEKGQLINFGVDAGVRCDLHIKLTKNIPKIQKELPTFSLNDGQFLFDTTNSGDGFIVGRSRETFNLLPKKGINLPGSVYDEDLQFQIYKRFIGQIEGLEINGLGLSFVQTGDLVSKLKKIVPNLVLISKIENSEGLRNCEEISNISDAIMIDRGDLVAEIGFKNLFKGIETISLATKSSGRPLIMATENLDSMIDRELPSKSEVMSLAHSASLGVDCIMLSEETALSSNAKATVAWLTDFLDQSFGWQNISTVKPRSGKYSRIWESLKAFRDLPILIMSKSGYAVFDYFAHVPDGALTLVTQNAKISMLSKLFRNEIRIINSNLGENIPIETIIATIKLNKALLFNGSKQIVAVYVSKYVNTPRANCITLLDADDF